MTIFRYILLFLLTFLNEKSFRIAGRDFNQWLPSPYATRNGVLIQPPEIRLASHNRIFFRILFVDYFIYRSGRL